MSVEENRRRFAEWQEDVPGIERPELDQEFMQALDVPAVHEMLDWVAEMELGELTFILSLATSELVGRLGMEELGRMFNALLDDPIINEVGALVHAARVMEMGGTPDEFLVNDNEGANDDDEG